jgi:hypothetical protein
MHSFGNLRCVETPQSEDVTCTAAEAGNHAYILVLIPAYLTARCHTSKLNSSGTTSVVHLLEFDSEYLPGQQLPSFLFRGFSQYLQQVVGLRLNLVQDRYLPHPPLSAIHPRHRSVQSANSITSRLHAH